MPTHAAPAPRTAMAHGTGWLQRQCACGAGAGLSGHCDDCARRSMLALQRKAVPAALAASTPGDALEHEADVAADQALRRPGTPGSHLGAMARPAPLLQRRAAPAGATATPVPQIVQTVLRTPGRPLDAPARRDFEQRFGHDFAQVRVHTDGQAAASADAVRARAYTVGHHIVFARAQFDPAGSAGRRLLAHELAHTVQQAAAGPLLARAPAEPAAQMDQLEVGEAPATADPSEQPWLVYRDAGAKADRRVLLPKGTRVAATGKPVTDVRGTQRIVLRAVRVLSLPGEAGVPADLVGRQGMVQTRYLVAVAAPAADKKPGGAAPASAQDFARRRQAALEGVARQRAEQQLQAQRAQQATVGNLQVSRGKFGNVGGGGALQVTAQAMAEPVKEQALAVHAALSELAQEIEKHPLSAFLGGLVDGIRTTLAPEVFTGNIDTFAKFAVLWPLSPGLQLAFFTGTATGVKKEIEGLVELVQNFGEVLDQVIELAKAVASEGGADITRALGHQIGADAARRLNEVGGIRDLDKLATALGETFGPILLEAALGIASGGSSAAASAATRMGGLLARFPKLAAFLDRLRGLRKLRRAADKALPDAPHRKPGTPGPRSAGKHLPQAQAKELRELALERRNIKPVRDAKLRQQGYDVELHGREHTYRRRSDGSWCRFSTPECGFTLDPQDEDAIRKAAELADDKALDDTFQGGQGGQPHETTDRLKRGNIGERLATEALGADGHTVLDFKPDISGTNQGGIDMLTMKGGTVYFLDNKALTRSGNVSSVSALTTNFAQNKASALRAMKVARDAAPNPAERGIWETAIQAVESGNFKKVVTNANLTRNEAVLTGVTDRLAQQGIGFIDVFKPLKKP